MSVQATARITAAPDGRGGTALPVLESDGPLALRRTRAAVATHARVTVVGAMSAPLGGDRLALEAVVTDGAALTVDAAAAMIALPGHRTGDGPADHAGYGIQLTVGESAVLHWLPEQLISVTGSDLRTHTRAELAPTARLVLREELILGRHGEAPGTVTTRLTVHRAGRPLLDQHLALGPGAPGGWDGGAVIGGHRAVGQLLLVRPEFEEKPVAPRLLGDTAVLTPLAGPGALVTALAPDARVLRQVLDEALAELYR
ncbi:urease accessory protein UreD [Streptomyces sp. NBC_01716]|uniref:urease accessory protein UreD n=1 Tax=Streptomyces sp. NBC_01716 TaxID=2975917 RepID=UPI002E36559C|nr:urease accessory protein UreD [Streptomyces sp. NBC_01716]